MSGFFLVKFFEFVGVEDAFIGHGEIHGGKRYAVVGEFVSFELDFFERVLPGVNVAGDRGFLFCLPEGEFVGGDEEVDRFFLDVEFGNDGVGAGVDDEVVGALEGDSAKETHVDFVFDVGEHVRWNGLEWYFVAGEHFDVVERFFRILLGYNDAELLTFALEVAQNILDGVAMIVNENGFLVGFDFFGKLIEMHFVFVRLANELIDEGDDFLAIRQEVVFVSIMVANFLHLFHLFFQRFDGFDGAAFERVDERFQDEQIKVFGPNVAFNLF